jgi:hypothetical protein
MIVGNVSRESVPGRVRRAAADLLSTPKRRTGAGGLSTESGSPRGEALRGHFLMEPARPRAVSCLGKSPGKTKRIDIGLAILGTKPMPRSGRSRSEIAAFCGCSRERIRQIEESALRRLRNRCIFLKDQRLRQAGEEILGRSVPL